MAAAGHALDVAAVLDRLCHRYPVGLVDAVSVVEPGKRISAVKNVTINEAFFQGHFPEAPLMPGVLLIESLTQAATLLLLYDGEQVRNARTVLRRVTGTKFRLEFNRDINAWLKCHLAFVLPICFAVYASGGDLRKIAGNKAFINKVIDAIDEAYQMLLACGVPMEPPDSLSYVRDKRAKCYRLIKVIAATPLAGLG